GAAGGNLGGGSIVDETPGVDDGNGVRITEITFQSAGGDSSVLDLTRDLDCDDDATTTDDAENFVFPTYKVTVENRTQTSITIDSVQLRIADSGPDGTTSVARTVVIAAGTTGTVSGNLATTAGCASQGFFCNSGTGTTSLDLCYPGSGDQVQPGTHNVTATVSGSNENGDDFDVSSRTSITWDCVNNCS
ncbi:MAG: hypothetical protein IT290_10460, partial [Deltaproteobacteria bacterium]|nr:hypothetical protein [Deltaproteobacteria bacterium]